ncbi:MAG: hypothetical protein B0A82_08815 [Alkalinema sp. CACIAM 70d]|nr:MAG: hypothetical protein B0A82_08815 [Alkalinema sp. CACIAM 70d]
MIRKVLLFTFLLLNVGAFNVQAQSCPTSANEQKFYQLRENNGNRRCEGIQKRQIGSSLDVASLTVGRLQSGDSLSLKVPVPPGGTEPVLSVRELEQNYVLDKVKWDRNSGWYEMRWSANVLNLKNVNIPPERLLALAEVQPSGSNSLSVLVPVILNSNDKRYEIVFRCEGCEARIKNNKIEVSAGNEKMSCTENKGNSQVLRFYCDGKTKPAGKYKISIDYDVKPTLSSRYESTPPLVRYFRHNPQWLK